mmetsp:Transcript_120492/g.276033  ORF Transcript_120492/g.276033 Transcript_120492/m.276033 type:complete len:275 (-) Transcript_120492:545-1369(-)
MPASCTETLSKCSATSFKVMVNPPLEAAWSATFLRATEATVRRTCSWSPGCAGNASIATIRALIAPAETAASAPALDLLARAASKPIAASCTSPLFGFPRATWRAKCSPPPAETRSPTSARSTTKPFSACRPCVKTSSAWGCWTFSRKIRSTQPASTKAVASSRVARVQAKMAAVPTHCTASSSGKDRMLSRVASTAPGSARALPIDPASAMLSKRRIASMWMAGSASLQDTNSTETSTAAGTLPTTFVATLRDKWTSCCRQRSPSQIATTGKR